jgi:transcriptional regulator of acetoin/glycerol metabolism
VVLTRLTADHDLERHLDGIQPAPGLQHAEEYVGTNGIGTALESGRPAHVFGHEHYAEDFEDLACAATPIHGPISGKMVGAVDLTRWRKDADALLIALAKTTADQITQALPAAGSAPEVEPLQEYLRRCTSDGTRPGASVCWTPWRPAARTGRWGSALSCSTARAAW